jgi:hypothetical protein
MNECVQYACPMLYLLTLLLVPLEMCVLVRIVCIHAALYVCMYACMRVVCIPHAPLLAMYQSTRTCCVCMKCVCMHACISIICVLHVLPPCTSFVPCTSSMYFLCARHLNSMLCMSMYVRMSIVYTRERARTYMRTQHAQARRGYTHTCIHTYIYTNPHAYIGN